MNLSARGLASKIFMMVQAKVKQRNIEKSGNKALITLVIFGLKKDDLYSVKVLLVALLTQQRQNWLFTRALEGIDLQKGRALIKEYSQLNDLAPHRVK